MWVSTGPWLALVGVLYVNAVSLSACLYVCVWSPGSPGTGDCRDEQVRAEAMLGSLATLT